MKSLFKTEKREAAFERIALAIIDASRNCTIITKRINALSQKPDIYPNPRELINEWASELFFENFYDPEYEWSSPLTISTEGEEQLTNAFFNYIVSLTPLYYENRTVIMHDNSQKFRWTSSDFADLKRKILMKWFYNGWDDLDGHTKLRIGIKIERDIQNVVNLIGATSYAKSKIWNRTKEIEKVILPNSLNSIVGKTMPLYKHQFQADLYNLYTKDFITKIPAAFERFDNSFYEAGNYFLKYFQWSRN